MNARREREPDCSVRAQGQPDGSVRLFTRNHVLTVEGQLSVHPRSTHPSALDQLMAALAGDVVAGFAAAARRRGVVLDGLELSLTGRLANPLVPLGVVGEAGSARLAAIDGSLYVTSDAAEADVRALLDDALARSPVHATLAAAATIHIVLKLVP